ncbi:MAG TPA: DUF5995 family protein [Candidatus Sulfomarinibacteraceae bacterium]|nr:DUF5995 family protein [Candidatus Sulfomarinibacteraceae bacterium]
MSQEPPVIQRMQQRVQRWQRAADQRAVFLHCYMMMTDNMLRAVDAGEFEDRQWVSRLLHRFADYYFEALDVYEQDRDAAPAVWRTAHDATLAGKCRAVQRLFLGVNAHINYDLVLALVDVLEGEWPAADEALRQRRYRDHCYVNEVIARTVDVVQDEVVERAEPVMDVVDKLMGPVDEWLTAWLIRRWRDEVWHNAMRYLQAEQPQARASLRLQIEAMTLRRADVILLRNGLALGQGERIEARR